MGSMKTIFENTSAGNSRYFALLMPGFKQAAVIEDEAMNTYYRTQSTLKRQHPDDTDEQLHAAAETF